MKRAINFLNPGVDRHIKAKINSFLSNGWLYPQVDDYVEETGYYLPFDQFNALREVFNIQLDLQVGHRRGEIT